MQILILGMHRSGTSCVTRLINMMGAYFSSEEQRMLFQSDNPKGFWERRDVMQLNNEILEAAGGTWDKVAHLDLTKITQEQKDHFQKQIQTIVSEMDAYASWVIKDPRMCLVYQFWKPLLKSPVSIFVYRNPIQIAQSMAKRNNIPLFVGIALWEYYTVNALNAIQGTKTLITHYEDIMRDPVSAVEQLAKKLEAFGATNLQMPDKQDISSFITPDLYHNQDNTGLFSDFLNSHQLELNNIFENETLPDVKQLEISQSSIEILTDYAARQVKEQLEEKLTVVEREYATLSQQQSSLLAKHNSLIVTHDSLLTKHEDLTQVHLALQDAHSKESGKVAQLDSWLREIERDIRDTFTSFRWKAGNAIVSPLEFVLRRSRQRTAKDHIEEILHEYEAFLVESGCPPVANQNKRANETASSFQTLCRLGLVALKNPVQTARMLDPERLKNLYITLFKQSSHVRGNIFDYYMNLYGEPTASAPKNILVENKDLPSLEKPFTLPKIARPLVSIIIPVYNQWEYTVRCIYSVAKSAAGLRYEIILADDQSTDETNKAAEYYPGLKVVKTIENSGFLINCNNAASQVTGDYLVFLNNDTIVHENWLQAMLEVMENPKTGMTGSKLIYPDGKLQEAGGIIWDDASGWNYGRLDTPEKPEYNYIKTVDYISGASIMIRTALWREIGGFDECYIPAYYEDTDLAFAVRNKGFEVVFTPFSVVTHFEGQSHGTDETSGIKQHQITNKEKFYNKWQRVLQGDHYPNGENIFLARDRSEKMKTMLVIDHYVPHYDKDAGSRSTWQYLQWFVKVGLNVKFIGDNFYQHEPYTTELQKLGIEVLHGPWYEKNWQQWLKENGQNIDYIYSHRPHIAPKYIETARQYSKAKIIYFGHDLHYLRLQRQYEIEKDDNLLEMAEQWKKKEFSIFEKVDVIYYPSPVEEKEVKKHYPDKCIRAIPLNIYDTIKTETSHFADKQGLMFVGGFGHPPNLDGVTWFINEVFPLILEQNQSIQFTVVGSKIPDQIRELASENIIIAGEVSDTELANIYNKSRVAIVPVRFGAGIKGKVLEALQKQTPVVTTDIGAEGLPDPTSYLSISNSPDEFARLVLCLYTDKKLWNKQVKEGVSCLNTHFSSERVKEIWCQDIELS